MNRPFPWWLFVALITMGCYTPTDPADRMHPQSVVLMATPKFISDFDHPEADITRFLENYRPLTSRASETIVIFSVGNSDHILEYRGMGSWDEKIEWARTTDFVPVFDAELDYHQVAHIVAAFRSAAVASGIRLKIYDQVDSGSEFTLVNNFKYVHHPECTANQWGMFDIRGRLSADHRTFASAPEGIPEGTECGEFLADQVAAYTRDLGFDGMMFDNQLGTRGRWHDGDGVGFSVEESLAIQNFLEYSKRMLQPRELMWFDSYNNIQVERETFSFPLGGYKSFDYLIASGFCVTVKTRPYSDNLASKLSLSGGPKILATLDYVDPWYSYNSMTDYAGCSQQLEQTAIDFRYEIDGLMFFANDDDGSLIPAAMIKSFADRYWGR
jgi:hypothetical protein